jgi:hypothetical protein
LKTVALVAVPPAVVILILPVTARLGTVAVTCVLPFTVKLVAVAPNITFVVPVKPAPVITTLVPTGPLIGAKLVICGMTRNFLLLVSTPPGVVTATEPVVAPLGTLAGSKRQQAAELQSACAPPPISGPP